MAKILLSAANIEQDLQEIINVSARIVTPTKLAAKALNVAPYTLENIAEQILADRAGITVVPAIYAYQLLRESIREIVNPQDLEGTTRTWMPTIRTILQSVAHPQALLDNLPKITSPRTQLLLRVVDHYQQQLRKRVWVDQSEILWRAIAEPVTPQDLCIYGYFDPRSDELAFIQAIASEESLIYLPCQTDHGFFHRQENAIEQLRRTGWQIHTPVTQTSPPSLGEQLAQRFIEQKAEILDATAIHAHVYPDKEAEARGILKQIKQLLHTDIPAQNIVIVANDETTWGALLLDIAWEYKVPLRLPYQIPLTETRIGAWLTLLLEAIAQDFPFELTAQLLGHPLSHRAGKDFWAEVREQRPTGFAAWQDICQTKIPLDLSVLKLPESATREAWLQILTTIFDRFELRKNAAPWAKESVAYKKLVEGLAALGQPPQEAIAWTEFREEVLTSLAVLSTAAYPGRGGVEVHNPQTLMGASYDYVFVIDALEGKLPRQIQDDPVLDFHERKRLKQAGFTFDDAADLARQEAFRFYALLQTPLKAFTLSYANIDSQGNSYSVGEASPYIQRLGLQPTVASQNIVVSEEEARQIYLQQPHPPELQADPVFHQAIAAHGIELNRANNQPPDEYGGVVGIPFDYSDHFFSVSQLTQLGQCPFKWFANKILRLNALDEPDDQLDVGWRGRLYHKVLELALIAYQQQPELDLTDATQLLLWFKAAETDLNFPDFPTWDSQRQEHIQILQRAIAQPSFLSADTTVLALEQKIQGEWQGLPITGYIDRIDQTAQGLVIMDYKTSSKTPAGIKDETGNACLDLQLPIYKADVADLYPDQATTRTRYYSLTQGKDISISSKKVRSEEEFMAAGDRLKQHLKNGSYPVEPDLKREACRYCDFDSVCRKTEEEEE